jgi:hypothetical protein
MASGQQCVQTALDILQIRGSSNIPWGLAIPEQADAEGSLQLSSDLEGAQDIDVPNPNLEAVPQRQVAAYGIPIQQEPCHQRQAEEAACI